MRPADLKMATLDEPREPDGPARPGNEDDLAADVVFDLRARKQAEALYAEVQMLREQMAAFESRYRMTFEEFQASFAPGEDSAADEDYLEWSRLAESYRLRRQQWENALRRAASPVRMRPEPDSKAREKRDAT